MPRSASVGGLAKRGVIPRKQFYNKMFVFNTVILVGAAACNAALIIFLPTMWTTNGTNAIAAEILDNHLHALQPGHLIDVESSYQHTVKPWFQGKTDFSPPVPDLTNDGFVLGLLLRAGRHALTVGRRAGVCLRWRPAWAIGRGAGCAIGGGPGRSIHGGANLAPGGARCSTHAMGAPGRAAPDTTSRSSGCAKLEVEGAHEE